MPCGGTGQGNGENVQVTSNIVLYMYVAPVTASAFPGICCTF